MFPGCHSDATALLKTEQDGVKGVSVALGSVINEKFKMELDACIFKSNPYYLHYFKLLSAWLLTMSAKNINYNN